jgi:MFS family permease
MSHEKGADGQVPERFYRFFRELDRRVQVTIAGIGIHNWGQQLTMQYTQLYATDLGADALDLGLLNSITAAVSSIVSVPLGWVTEKYTVRKVLLLGLACAAMSAAISALAGNWLMLIPAFVIGARLVRIMPLADIIFITATQSQHRATVMGLSRVAWGTLNLFAPMAAALIIANSGGISAQGIRPLYYIQLVLTVLVLLFMARKLQPLPSHVDRKAGRPGLKGGTFIQDFRELFQGEKWLKRWMALRVIQQFGNSLATPFVALWMVNVKGATPHIIGMMGTASAITSLALQVPAGRLADRIGRKRVFLLLRPVSYLGTFLLILAPRPEYLILVGLLGAAGAARGAGGGIGGVSFTPFITMFWEMVSDEKRGRWFGIEGLMSLSTIPASILGGVLWQQGLMTEVLLLPILIEVLLVIPILTTVPDTLETMG